MNNTVAPAEMANLQEEEAKLERFLQWLEVSISFTHFWFLFIKQTVYTSHHLCLNSG